VNAVTESAPAKVNLVLQVGAPTAEGMHPLCSLFARLDLADGVTVEQAAADEVVCPGVTGPNLAARAVAAYRAAAGGPSAVPPLRVTIRKRIPVAGGMGGGSADAAAVLRAAGALTGHPVARTELVAVARELGSDVPSQLDPAHALVEGEGEVVEAVNLATMTLVLLPDPDGLSTGAVYAELDRLRAAGQAAPRAELQPGTVRAAAALDASGLAAALDNDLQPAALSLRPALRERLGALRGAGALGTLITGSGPTAFGVFAERGAAEQAAAGLAGSIVTGVA
jgi:4-diphosphocytidyl-2-C-methyl-D-erythritol kinase